LGITKANWVQEKRSEDFRCGNLQRGLRISGNKGGVGGLPQVENSTSNQEREERSVLLEKSGQEVVRYSEQLFARVQAWFWRKEKETNTPLKKPKEKRGPC